MYLSIVFLAYMKLFHFKFVLPVLDLSMQHHRPVADFDNEPSSGLCLRKNWWIFLKLVSLLLAVKFA